MKVGDLVWVYSLDHNFDLNPESRYMMKVLNTNVSGSLVKVEINPRIKGSDYMSVYRWQIKKPTDGEVMLYRLES